MVKALTYFKLEVYVINLLRSARKHIFLPLQRKIEGKLNDFIK